METDREIQVKKLKSLEMEKYMFGNYQFWKSANEEIMMFGIVLNWHYGWPFSAMHFSKIDKHVLFQT